MLQKIKNILRPFVDKYRIYKQLRSLVDPVFVDGFPEGRNFGDALNMTLVKYLSRRDTFPSRFLKQTAYKEDTSYAVIGSICQWSRPQTIIWGAGFISDAFKTKDFVKPSQVLAVRGPLSRAIYQANGIDCPACYGDPALLLPLIYNPTIEPIYEYGIIPHYVDWESPWVNRYRAQKNVLVVNIMIGDNHELFVKQLKSCRNIITSSLHGLILAQAYGIPVCAVKFSESVMGGEFKFTDYLLSVGKTPKERINLFEQEILIEELPYDHESIQIDLAPLIEVCPFIQPDQRQHLLSENNDYYQLES
ncbi:polysaccharide pyruvyl transferase family protein [Sphingobacterium haloxyli]|uniref:Polysaccharide pyruvyl transferase domain-containing protein n=1 Tax=Sphingobacterium haloxyli TaxID=2100533 RepID=A0A2S9J639_9SPHI|nr:polysaccharide pyruvyl transferase family protein [Sphingobacterium haloxyli]PRD48209.1 hypothetical protein C5745_06800 [Sphingobacterium haloxyli]